MKKINKFLSLLCAMLLTSTLSYGQYPTDPNLPFDVYTTVTWTTFVDHCDDIIIHSGGKLILSNTTLELGYPNKITVKNGGQIIVDNSTIQGDFNESCSYMPQRWNGIQFENTYLSDPNTDPAVIIKNGSVLTYANTAITGLSTYNSNSSKARRIDITNSSFTDNVTHMYLAYPANNTDPGITNIHSVIDECLFDNSGPRAMSIVRGNDIDFTNNEIHNYDNSNGINYNDYGMYVYGSKNLYFGYNLFNNTGTFGMIFSGPDNAINNTVYTTENITLLNNRFYSNSTPNELNFTGYNYTAIYFGQYPGTVTSPPLVTGNKIDNISISYSTLLNTNPDLSYTYCGIYTDVIENNNMEIHINYMDYFHTGVSVNNCLTTSGSYIYDNDFQKCGIGVQSRDNNSQLSVSCNNFDSGGLGIQVTTGSSLKNQLTADHMDQYITNGMDIECLSTTSFLYSYSNLNSNYAIQFNGNVVPLYTPDVVKCEGQAPSQRQANIVETNLMVDVHPNPASDILTIELDQVAKDGTITLIDQLGKVILTQPLNSLSENIDISSLENGMYILNIESNGRSTTKKVLIQ